jgi:hypothetical protein
MSLYSWGRTQLKDEEFRTDAQYKLREKALELFGVSSYTASNYASVVFYRLKKDEAKANDS